jgi:hypothetical protein
MDDNEWQRPDARAGRVERRVQDAYSRRNQTTYVRGHPQADISTKEERKDR